MNTPEQSSTVQGNTSVRFFRWLTSWRTVRRALIVLAWLVTLIVLFHAEENWRGRRAWNQYRQSLEARGEQLDFRMLIPKPVPDEQNFAATPVIKSWFEKKDDGTTDQRWNDRFAAVEKSIPSSSPQDGKGLRHFEDLVAWAGGFAAAQSSAAAEHKELSSSKFDLDSRAKAAPAVLQGLKTNEALFAELRLASERPYSRYPIDYNTDMLWTLQLPHLGMLRGTCQRLRLRACAELALGQSEQALADLRLVFYLADSLKSDPCLISALVRFACVQLAEQPLWEGLAEHRWSDPQLQALEARLAQYHFVADTKPAFDAERAFGTSVIEFLRRKGPAYLNAVANPESVPTPGGETISKLIGWIFIPRGWFCQEEMNYCQGFQTQVAEGADFPANRVLPAQVKVNAHALEATVKPPGFAGKPLGLLLRHRLMSEILLPALNKVLIRAAAAQTAMNEEAIACALERYRLANGRFPGKQDALVPQFISALPNDVLTGEPYKDRRTEDGRFVLYSIGWDEKDDGGQPGKTLFDEKQGDWVWEYPAPPVVPAP